MLQGVLNENRDLLWWLWSDMQHHVTPSEFSISTRVFMTRCSKAEQSHKQTWSLPHHFWISLRRPFSFMEGKKFALVLTVPNSSVSQSELPMVTIKQYDQDENQINACSTNHCLGSIWTGIAMSLRFREEDISKNALGTQVKIPKQVYIFRV